VLIGQESCTSTDEEFLQQVAQAQTHCKRGDVFQMVLSRRFKQTYHGDEFNVYRALRHINPSPYMFFFDYAQYKIFGSSPEAQIRIIGKEASVNPIAGTYKRTGDKEQDKQLAEALLQDKKEIAEHAMLVDLARNDMNRHCDNVHVSAYKTIQQYSHVIHIVSTVKGWLKEKTENVEVLADTFPAGTLSGAPKVRAMQILANLEKHPRGFYGGSIGFIDFNGDINQAIIIRSFMAKNQQLHYQAGAGIVLKSQPESELQEVNNKLGALRKALQQAEQL
jgi:anthranilate synthase component 1